MGKINKKLPLKRPKIQLKSKKAVIHDFDDNIKPEEKTTEDNKGSGPKTNLKVIEKNKKIEDKSKILFKKTVLPKQLKTKKEKTKLKRIAFLNKIDLIKEQELENVKRKKREKTRIIGDLNPLRDALPSLDELLKLKRDQIKTGIEDIKPKTKKEKFKQKNKEVLDRYKCFNSILKDKKFKQNPREVIAQHIKFLADNQN